MVAELEPVQMQTAQTTLVLLRKLPFISLEIEEGSLTPHVYGNSFNSTRLVQVLVI